MQCFVVQLVFSLHLLAHVGRIISHEMHLHMLSHVPHTIPGEKHVNWMRVKFKLVTLWIKSFMEINDYSSSQTLKAVPSQEKQSKVSSLDVK